jgi:hypothetical protein
VTEHLLHGRLVNSDGELLAEGPCWLDEAAGQATLEPERAAGVIQKERGRLSLQLDSGRNIAVSDRPIIISMQGQNGNKNVRRRLFRLRLLDHIPQDAPTSNSVGAPAKFGNNDQAQQGSTGAHERDNHAQAHNIAQDAGAVGAVGEGSPTSQDVSPRAIGETPAAR